MTAGIAVRFVPELMPAYLRRWPETAPINAQKKGRDTVMDRRQLLKAVLENVLLGCGAWRVSDSLRCVGRLTSEQTLWYPRTTV